MLAITLMVNVSSRGCCRVTTRPRNQSSLLKAVAGLLKEDKGHIKKGSITVSDTFVFGVALGCTRVRARRAHGLRHLVGESAV